MYWQATSSISKYGIGQTGNAGYNDASSLLGFDAHGPLPATFYGAIFHVFGLNTPGWFPIVGIVLVCLALLSLLLIAAPNPPAAIAASAIVGLSPYSQIYLPTFMSEAWNIALVVLFVGLIYWANKHPRSRFLFFLALMCVSVLVATRITYVFLLVPLILIPSKLPRVQLVVRNCASIALVGITAFVSRLFTAEYPESFLTTLQTAIETDFGSAMSLLAHHTISNIQAFLDPTNGTFIEVSFRYIYLLVLGYCCYRGIRVRGLQQESRRDQKPANHRWSGLLNWHFITAFVMLATLAAVIMFYDVFGWRDFRVLAPILMGASLFLILSTRRFGLFLATVTVLLGVTLYIPQVSSLPVLDYGTQRLNPAACGDSVTTKAIYHPNSNDQWKNTILIVDAPLFPQDALNCLPAGIGINYDFDNNAQPDHAGYILTESADYSPPQRYSLVAQGDGLFLYYSD